MTIIVTDDGFHADDLDEFTTLEDIASDTRLLSVENAADPLQIAKSFAQLDVISISFPSFTDGRGFSLARQLRQLGFSGKLRAAGHLISDQYYHARRAGFDEVAISDDLAKRQPEDNWTARLDHESLTYQDVLNAN